MENIPEELKKRWTEKERWQTPPEIATIDLIEHEPLPPELDSLDESPEYPARTGPMRFYPEESQTPASPWIDPLKLHGTQSVAPGTISIATYAPKRLPKTGHHS